MDLILVENFINNLDTTYNNKLARALTFYAWWRYKDMEKQILKKEVLLVYQKS